MNTELTVTKNIYLWNTETKKLIKLNFNEIPTLKVKNTYLNTEIDECDLFADTLENSFTLKRSLNRSTNIRVQQKLSTPDILLKNVSSIFKR